VNEAQTSHAHAVGVCSGVGTYAGGFFVRPNKINFSETLMMFTTPWKNPVGIILVAAIFLLFFVLLFWAVRTDKKDALLVSVQLIMSESL